MSIRLGTITAVVVSSLEAVELFLKTHDTNFASRPRIRASEYLSYGTKGLVFAKYGPFQRNIRKLYTLQLLSPSKARSFAELRREEIGVSLVELLKTSAARGEVVDLSRKIGEAVEDISTRMILGWRRDDERYNLKGVAEEVFTLAGAFTLADYVPFLGALDLQVLSCYFVCQQ